MAERKKHLWPHHMECEKLRMATMMAQEWIRKLFWCGKKLYLHLPPLALTLRPLTSNGFHICAHDTLSWLRSPSSARRDHIDAITTPSLFKHDDLALACLPLASSHPPTPRLPSRVPDYMYRFASNIYSFTVNASNNQQSTINQIEQSTLSPNA